MSLGHLKNVLKHYVVLLKVYKRFRMSLSYLFCLRFVIFKYEEFWGLKGYLTNDGAIIAK